MIGSRSRLGSLFFGQTHSDATLAAQLAGQAREEQLNEFWILVRWAGFSYTEVRAMPIRYRQWFIQKLIKEREENKGQETSVEQAVSQALPASTRRFST